MVNVNDIKNGMTIEVDGNIYTVLDFSHIKPGKGAAIVKMKLKNLRTGAISSDGSKYSTVLELNGNKITLNGVDINSDIKSDESDEKSVKKDLTIDLDSL